MVWMFVSTVLTRCCRRGVMTRIRAQSDERDHDFIAMLAARRMPDPTMFYHCSRSSWLAMAWLAFHRAEFQFAENV